LSPFEKAELKRLLELDVSNLSQIPIQSVLGYEQEYWRNPASVHVIRPEDITLNGYLNSVEALRGVPGMHVSRGLAYDNFASMRNFSGFSTQKFLGKIGGREVSQLMLGSANYSVDDYPVAVIDRIEVIRGPGASIWGTNAVNGVLNLVTKHSAETQGDSVRVAVQDNGTFLGDYVHGGALGDNKFYRFWIRDQEYIEGTLDSGLPARDDGYLRKAGFRFDGELGSDLSYYISGGVSTRRLEHVLDLSNRLLYNAAGESALVQGAIKSALGLNAAMDLSQVSVPLSVAQSLASAGLPLSKVPSVHSYNSPAWANVLRGQIPYQAIPGVSIARFDRYAPMTNESAHLISHIEGITNSDLEWKLTGSVEQTDIDMGHLGLEWEQTQFNLTFDANFALSDRHRISYGLSAQHTDLDVESSILDVFQFPGEPLKPILDYEQSFTQFDRFNAYIQDSISVSEEILFSIGAKFEENDLAGFGFQPGIRASWMANENNLLWAGYAKTHRQPSLRERYTDLTPFWVWNSVSEKWVSSTYSGGPTLDREEMDAYELGWRLRPNADLMFEFSSYFYDTENAVRAATSVTSVNAYEAKNAEAFGGELSFDYRASDLWRIRGGYSIARGEVDGSRVYDFPETTASLSSHFKYSDDVTLIQNLFYSGKTEIPSDYNPITIPSHLRLDLGVVWQTNGDWEIGLFGRDLLEPYHTETMFPGVDVEPARVERTFMLTLLKKF
jgi:outer membrane receptor for ferrienterochelin and colicin